MIEKFIKIFCNIFFIIQFNNNIFCDNVIRNRYFTLSAKDTIIRCTKDLVNTIDQNNFENHELDINKINEDRNIYEFLKGYDGNLGATMPKDQNLKDFLNNCNNIYSENECYKSFLNVGFDDNGKYKVALNVALIFLKLIIIELDYEKKIQMSFEKYVNDNIKKFDKVKAKDKDFFQNFYDAKFFNERAKALIIINKSLLNSISLFIEKYKTLDKEKILKFIIHQTYNKMFNIDYLWILYTYGFRGTDVLKKGDSGYNPFMSDLFKQNYS